MVTQFLPSVKSFREDLALPETRRYSFRAFTLGEIMTHSLTLHVSTAGEGPSRKKGKPMDLVSKPVSEAVQKAVIYQLFLRPFTPEGTLSSAARMLPHLAALGVDIVYLCPTMLADDDPRPEFWSPRQNASGLGNPCNPYRVKDYFHTDPEYGTNEDLRTFVDAAHRLGMKVLLDLVYFHCGPQAVFLQDHPGFVRHNPDGSVKHGMWHFPELNFENPELREYLWENMVFWIRTCGVDGYRTDVEGAVPTDFWEEGRRRMEAVKPEVVMLAESENPPTLAAAHDLSYAFAWSTCLKQVFLDGEPAGRIRACWEEMQARMPQGTRFIRCTENHDIAMDLGEGRWNLISPPERAEAAMLLNFTLDGVPFLYNGDEIGDGALHSIYGNRFHGKTYLIDWSKAMTPAGQTRLAFTRELIRLRHACDALTRGGVRWLPTDRPDAVAAFARATAGERIYTLVNATAEPCRARVETGEAGAVTPDTCIARRAQWRLAADGGWQADLGPYGFAVIRLPVAACPAG